MRPLTNKAHHFVRTASYKWDVQKYLFHRCAHRDNPNLELRAFHWNANGPTNVVLRAIRETDQEVLEKYPGEGEYFPLGTNPLAGECTPCVGTVLVRDDFSG